ncbi:hypothetical protein RCJ22_05970 [Vibrio sp. FNV 38]|nr:hypothetical protein [Vibrio sp. FNV 38]
MEVLSVIALLGAVFFMFFAVVHGGLSLAGREDDLFGHYQDRKKSSVKALTHFLGFKK